MKVQPNGTHAKDIALYFLRMTNQRATASIMGKTIHQAKSLLASGYTKEEVCDVIDFLVEEKGVDMYSLGYVNATINTVLHELQQKRMKEEYMKRAQTQLEEKRKEVVDDGKSAERNRQKAGKFGLQSRLGEKYHFDLFEE